VNYFVRPEVTMSYTTPATPLVVLVGEKALGNAIQLAMRQWPALFNYASETFFQSEWFLKKMDGLPYQPRLVFPIATTPTVLAAAATDPHYLAYPLDDLALPSAEAPLPDGSTTRPVPICLQVEDLLIEFPPLETDLASLDDQRLESQQVLAQVKLWAGMLADSPGLPAIPEAPVLLLKLPLEARAVLSASMVKDDNGTTRLDVQVVSLDLPDLQPPGLKQMVLSVVLMIAARMLPEELGKQTWPVEVKSEKIAAFPKNGSQAGFRIEFPSPLQASVRFNARQGNQPNPDWNTDRVEVFLELEMTSEEGA
jgi:hypothetical protein